MMHFFSQTLIILLIVGGIFGVAYRSDAASDTATSDFVLAPAIIDMKGKARDVAETIITIKNIGREHAKLYGIAYHLGADGTRQKFDTVIGRDTSLAQWFEFFRGDIPLKKGDTYQLKLTIRPSLHAKPGVYHALIAFVSKESSHEAFDNIDHAVWLTINYEIVDDAREQLQLKRFIPQHVVSGGGALKFLYELQNNGNRVVAPTGAIYIYKRNGEEVGMVDINRANASLDPARIKQFASVVENLKGFGRFKAMIDIAYGANGEKTTQDTVFFWILPWKWILGGLMVLLCSMIVLILYLRTYVIDLRRKDTNEHQ